MTIKPHDTGKCPHCSLSVRFEPVQLVGNGHNLGTNAVVAFNTLSQQSLIVDAAACPSCGCPILSASVALRPGLRTPVDSLLWPDSGARPVPPEVKAESPGLATDFLEAASVLPKSKKASAALSRRCLQVILVQKGGAMAKDLAKQIDEVLPHLPPSLAANVDAIRQVGNFAAHPVKSQSTGEIAEVEDGEAEWLLDVLEELFEYYFVGPAQAAIKRAALNKKLSSLGKPPLKSPAGSTGP